MGEMFAPEKCPKCGKATEVEHYEAGWRCICDCGWYGIFHFDQQCADCDDIHNLIAQGKASMLPTKCYPVGGSLCSFADTKG